VRGLGARRIGSKDDRVSVSSLCSRWLRLDADRTGGGRDGARWSASSLRRTLRSVARRPRDGLGNGWGTLVAVGELRTASRTGSKAGIASRLSSPNSPSLHAARRLDKLHIPYSTTLRSAHSDNHPVKSSLERCITAIQYTIRIPTSSVAYLDTCRSVLYRFYCLLQSIVIF
jgi:hypothetical protein